MLVRERIESLLQLADGMTLEEALLQEEGMPPTEDERVGLEMAKGAKFDSPAEREKKKHALMVRLAKSYKAPESKRADPEDTDKQTRGVRARAWKGAAKGYALRGQERAHDFAKDSAKSLKQKKRGTEPDASPRILSKLQVDRQKKAADAAEAEARMTPEQRKRKEAAKEAAKHTRELAGAKQTHGVVDNPTRAMLQRINRKDLRSKETPEEREKREASVASFLARTGGKVVHPSKLEKGKGGHAVPADPEHMTPYQEPKEYSQWSSHTARPKGGH